MRRRWVPAALLLLALLQPVPARAATVASTVETDPVTGTLDAADDPAIWIHPSDPSLSTVDRHRQDRRRRSSSTTWRVARSSTTRP